MRRDRRHAVSTRENQGSIEIAASCASTAAFQRTADEPARHVVVRQRDGADATGHLVGRAVLIERLVADAVRKTLHHERAVRNDREDAGGHSHVVAEEVAFRRGQIGPEDLLEVADVERVAVGQRDDAFLAAVLEVLQLIDNELEGLGGSRDWSDWRGRDRRG
jgi:hypothetical protein